MVLAANEDDRTVGKCRGCHEQRPLIGWLGFCGECSTAMKQFFARRRRSAQDRKNEAERQRIQKEASSV